MLNWRNLRSLPIPLMKPFKFLLLLEEKWKKMNVSVCIRWGDQHGNWRFMVQWLYSTFIKWMVYSISNILISDTFTINTDHHSLVNCSVIHVDHDDSWNSLIGYVRHRQRWHWEKHFLGSKARPPPICKITGSCHMSTQLFLCPQTIPPVQVPKSPDAPQCLPKLTFWKLSVIYTCRENSNFSHRNFRILSIIS